MKDKGYIQSFDKSIFPWERGVRKGGLMDIKAMTHNLLDFKDVLDKNNMNFALMAGTLLGAIRQQSFIPYDTDVDVACFNSLEIKDHWNLKSVKEDLIKKGFRVIGSDVCYLHSDFFIRNGEKIDMFWFTKVDDEWIAGETLRYPIHYFNNLEEIDFLGTKFKVPSNASKFLELSYGKNWRIPNPDAQHLNLNPKEVRKRK